MDTRNLTWLLAGAVCGVALILSCGDNGPPMSLDAALTDGAVATADAAPDAAPADCSTWQFAYATPTAFTNTGQSVDLGAGTATIFEVPAGWEPFGAESTSGILIRRCRP